MCCSPLPSSFPAAVWPKKATGFRLQIFTDKCPLLPSSSSSSTGGGGWGRSRSCVHSSTPPEKKKTLKPHCFSFSSLPSSFQYPRCIKSQVGGRDLLPSSLSSPARPLLQIKFEGLSPSSFSPKETAAGYPKITLDDLDSSYKGRSLVVDRNCASGEANRAAIFAPQMPCGRG